MRPIRSTLNILSISPALHFQSLACRNPLLQSQYELRLQCLVSDSLQTGSPAPLRRFSTTAAPHSPAPTASFTYHIAASFNAKNRKYRRREDYYTFNGSKSQDIFTGRPDSGQDAFFIAPVTSQGKDTMAFGVADGVGGWAESGIDSADFSHGLCETMASIASEENPDQKLTGPRYLLDQAYQKISEEGKIAGGGSTACIAVGQDDGNVTVANLGDSGFVQLRPAAIHHSSNPQTHAFNTPYQLSIVPPRVLALSRAFGGGPLSDLPSAADVTTLSARHGDVFVLATDGVWDNLSAEEILRIVTFHMETARGWTRAPTPPDHRTGTPLPELGPSRKRLPSLVEEGGLTKRADGEELQGTLQANLAAAIVQNAKAASTNQKRDGPFAREVRKHYPMEDYHGGKVDDICVVVAIVLANKRRDS